MQVPLKNAHETIDAARLAHPANRLALRALAQTIDLHELAFQLPHQTEAKLARQGSEEIELTTVHSSRQSSSVRCDSSTLRCKSAP